MISQGTLLRILYFLVFCCTASWLPVMADFCRHRGLDHYQTSLLLSITPVAMFIAQPVCGMLADRFGYKKVLVTAGLLATFTYLGYLHDGGFGWMLMVTILMSLFYNTIQPVLDSLSLQLSTTDPGYSYGSLRVAGAAGWSVTGIITGQTIDRLSLEMIFVISAVSMALVFVAALYLKSIQSEGKANNANPFAGAGTLLRVRNLAFFLFCVVLVSVGSTTIWNFYSLYMKEHGASASMVGFGLSFQGLCELPFFWFASKIIRRTGLK
ncbi:MAG: MFS transporter, partial [Bacteroidota bacterium]